MKHMALYKRTGSLLWEHGKVYYFLSFIQILASTSIPFLSYIYMGRIIQLLAIGDVNRLTSEILIYLVIFSLLLLVNTVLQPIVEHKQNLFNLKIGRLLEEKMLRMEYYYADNSKTREELSKLNILSFSSQGSINFLSQQIPTLLTYVIQIIWSLILLSPLVTYSFESRHWINSPWWFAVLLVGILAVGFLSIKLTSGTGKIFESFGDKLYHINARLNYEGTIQDDLESGKEIRLYRLSKRMIEFSKNENKIIRDMMKIVWNYQNKSNQIVYLATQILTFGAYALIGARIIDGYLPIGLLIQLSNSLSQLLDTTPSLIQDVGMIISNPQPLIDFFDFMDLPEEKEKGSIPVEKRLDNDYHLSVENLSFSYPNSDELVLKNITEDFGVGKKYAIVGENGSGKTTFIKVLMRLYEATSGQVNLNKIDSQKYKLSEYYSLFSVVFQDFRLLGFGLGQNIAVNQEYNSEITTEILKEVGLDEFVDELPKQLDTYLTTEFDNEGVSLSGGQAQRIAMARALYKDAPVMILDEPTAALDPIAEFEIYQKFDDMVEDKTAFYISHRLSSCRFCDEILVFDKGEVIQRGSHVELLKQPGKYFDLWHAQAQYYA